MLVWFCILAKLMAHTLRHPCLFMNALLALRPAKPLGVHFRHPCLFMNALLALRPAKPLGVHFRHPCLACPSRRTGHQHYRNPAIFSPSKNIVHNLTIAVIYLQKSHRKSGGSKNYLPKTFLTVLAILSAHKPNSSSNAAAGPE